MTSRTCASGLGSLASARMTSGGRMPCGSGAKGVAPARIARLLGHAAGRMVERVYGRIAPVDLEAAIAAQLAIASG